MAPVQLLGLGVNVASSVSLTPTTRDLPSKGESLFGIGVSLTGTVAYSGPGDAVAGATAFYGLRAYNAAYAATGTNPAVDIVDSSGANLTTIKILSTGSLDTAAVSAFIGAHGTPSVSKIYDQTGNGLHASQGTVASQPTLTLNGLGSLPCLTFGGAQILVAPYTATTAQPNSFSFVAKRTASFTTTNTVLGAYFTPGTTFNQFGFENSSNTGFVAGGTNADVAGFTDNILHAAQGVVNGATSSVNIDGTQNNSLSAGTQAIGTSVSLGAVILSAAIANAFNGSLGEGIFFASLALTPVQQSTLRTNQKAYWGTP